MAKTEKHKLPITPFKLAEGPTTITSVCWVGESAFMINEDNGFSVILTSPNKTQLQFFWDQLEKDKTQCNFELVKTTIGDYKFIEKPTVVKTKKEEKECFWFYDRKNDRCFPRCEDKVEGCKKLGPCVKNTENECRILLREIGWEREDIMEVPIDTIPW